MFPRNLLAIMLLCFGNAMFGQQNPASALAPATQSQTAPAHAATFQAATPAAPVISLFSRKIL